MDKTVILSGIAALILVVSAVSLFIKGDIISGVFSVVFAGVLALIGFYRLKKSKK